LARMEEISLTSLVAQAMVVLRNCIKFMDDGKLTTNP
jgi:hypothetical protein